jgi:hypothetical protein
MKVHVCHVNESWLGWNSHSRVWSSTFMHALILVKAGDSWGEDWLSSYATFLVVWLGHRVEKTVVQALDCPLSLALLRARPGSTTTSYPGLFASAVGWSAKKALASADLFCNLIGQWFRMEFNISAVTKTVKIVRPCKNKVFLHALNVTTVTVL